MSETIVAKNQSGTPFCKICNKKLTGTATFKYMNYNDKINTKIIGKKCQIQLISNSFHIADFRSLHMSMKLIKRNMIFRNWGVSGQGAHKVWFG